MSDRIPTNWRHKDGSPIVISYGISNGDCWGVYIVNKYGRLRRFKPIPTSASALESQVLLERYKGKTLIKVGA